MAVIDTHAHVSPERFRRAVKTEGSWYGLGPAAGELHLGGFDQPLEVRLAEMDAWGVDMQVLTPNVGFYQYTNDLDVTTKIARECNDEIAEMVADHPTRFSGMGTLPMQHVPSAVAELERVMGMGLKGVMVNDHAAGKTYDEPEFRPFFQAAEAAGAVVFFHQGGGTCADARIRRYKLGNSVGNLAERALVFGALVFGGVLDRYPDLKPFLAHAGGATTFAIVRMDKAAGALDPRGPAGELIPPFGPQPDDLYALATPPSDYLTRFWYDCCTYSGPILRFVIDTVGIGRVVLGSDYPAPMVLADAVNWVMDLPELTRFEKEAILSTNPATLFGL